MKESPAIPRRICVFGCSGSGKTTLARRLATELGIAHLELDSVFHGPNWQPYPREQFLGAVEDFVKGDRWVIDGNYSVTHSHTVTAADTLIYLDYSFARTFRQCLVRTMRRCVTKEELWNGNRESWLKTTFTRESILWWVIITWKRQRRRAEAAVGDEAFSGKNVLRFRRPSDTEAWISGISSSLAGADQELAQKP